MARRKKPDPARLRKEILGLLVAAAVVAGYHLALWRHDRTLLAAVAPARRRTIDRVTLVTTNAPESPDPDSLAQGIAKVTGGAKVDIWLRADGDPGAPATASGPSASEETILHVEKALDGITAQHVLVVLGPESQMDVVPLVARGAGRR